MTDPATVHKHTRLMTFTYLLEMFLFYWLWREKNETCVNLIRCRVREQVVSKSELLQPLFKSITFQWISGCFFRQCHRDEKEANKCVYWNVNYGIKVEPRHPVRHPDVCSSASRLSLLSAIQLPSLSLFSMFTCNQELRIHYLMFKSPSFTGDPDSD